MHLDGFDAQVVTRTVRKMRKEFYTGDIWNDPDMLLAHSQSPDTNGFNSYKQMTGKYLSARRTLLQITLMPDSKPGRGRRWVRNDLPGK